MSLYGINAYTSNTYYSTLMSGKNSYGSGANSSLANLLNSKKSSSGTDTLSFLKNVSKTDANTDLQTLMQKINLVRSKGYQKSMTEEYRKVFSGETAASTDAKANEKKLSESASKLGSVASDMVTGNFNFYSDSEGLMSKAKEFVKLYNETVDGLSKSESNLALQKGVSMVSTTAAYSKSLSQIGITVGKDNKLSLDETKFSSANSASVKSLFGGTYSYASKTAEKASYISRTANLQAQMTTYNSQGKTSSNGL